METQEVLLRRVDWPCAGPTTRGACEAEAACHWRNETKRPRSPRRAVCALRSGQRTLLLSRPEAERLVALSPEMYVPVVQPTNRRRRRRRRTTPTSLPPVPFLPFVPQYPPSTSSPDRTRVLPPPPRTVSRPSPPSPPSPPAVSETLPNFLSPPQTPPSPQTQGEAPSLFERAETVEWYPERALVRRPTRVANDQPWKNPRYTFVRPLGHGAFGQVHLAMDNEAKRYVAVKGIELAHGGGDGDSGVTEAEILSLLRSSCTTSGVLCLEKVFQEGQRAFLVTEALDEYERMDTVKMDRTAAHAAFLSEVVDQLGRAVQGVHRLGVAHRDLKPANIMIRRPASVKIIDFGVACAQNRCPTRELAGTPIYLAPELWSASLLAWETEGDARQTDREFSTEDWQAADWWALGASVAELLLGRPFLFWWWETVFPRDVVNRRDLRARLPTLRRQGVPFAALDKAILGRHLSLPPAVLRRLHTWLSIEPSARSL